MVPRKTSPCEFLSVRLPFDGLLTQLGEVGCVSSSLISLGHHLARKFRSSLNTAAREKGRKKWASSALLSSGLFGTIHLLQVLHHMADDAVQELEHSQDLVKELSELQESSSNFIQRAAAQEVQEPSSGVDISRIPSEGRGVSSL